MCVYLCVCVRSQNPFTNASDMCVYVYVCAESEAQNPNCESQKRRQEAMQMTWCHDEQDTGAEINGDA